LEGIEYFYELYEGLPRCGPGDNESTGRAYRAISDTVPHPSILDIGCGPGAQTLALAKLSNGTIVALDNHQPFLDTLVKRAKAEGLHERIVPKHQSMLEMKLEDGSFDIVWSEGALYFMGFQNGLRRCKGLLKSGGHLAVTEVAYLRADPPTAVTEFWEKEYPAMADVETKLTMIETEGFELISHFTLPESAWLDHFYLPMEERISVLREKYSDNRTAQEVLDEAQKEMDFYRRYSDYYGYEFFVMRKP